MDEVPQRLAGWWSRLDDHGRRHASVLALLCLGYLGHYLVYCIPQPFYIEDAAISFAYARNLVEGEGLVTYAGGERVEGYSNALWVFLVAAFYGLGVPVWTSSKLMGALFGVITLPLAYGLVRRARPGRLDDVALVAPLMLAASPQFVVWNASGLENSLFCVLLAGGMWRLVVELEDEVAGRWRFPWSAVLYFLLAMTRPEGLMYAVLGLSMRVLGSVASRRVLPLVSWVAVLGLPFGIYNLWRLWYFAWPFPNTYYAKLGKGDSFRPYNWNGSGWKYVKNYMTGHYVVYLAPLLAVGLAGLRRRRKWLVPLVLVALSVVLLWNGRDGIQDFEPAWWTKVRREWDEIRTWTIAISCALLGFATLGWPGWRARGLLWASACAAVFFALYSSGDWMKAHRWFNLVSVSLFPVLAIGLGELLDSLQPERFRLPLPRRKGASVSLRAVLVVLACGAWVGSEAWHSNAFANNPETSTRDVHRRVIYMKGVQRQLDLDEVTLLDVDMGAHVYFSGWKIVDFARLRDVPFSHHPRYNKKFVEEYVFEEHKPEFAHVHAGWARTSKIPTHKQWKEEYLEIPGYPIGARKLHVGNHIRKDTFVTRVERTAPDTAWRFGTDVDLVKIEVPSPEVPAGGEVFVDTLWQAGFREHDFEVLLVLDDGAGHRTVQAVDPGYGWYEPEEWGALEQVRGPFRVPLPAELPEGRYQLSVVLVDQESGALMPWRGLVGDLPASERVRQVKVPSRKKPRRSKEADVVPDVAPEEATAEAAELAEAGEPADLAEAVEGLPEGVASDTASQQEEETPVPPAAPATPLTGAWLEGGFSTGLEVVVVSPQEARRAAEADLAAAVEAASSDRCEEVWPSFKDATRHLLADLDWRSEREEELRRELARCWTDRAAEATERDIRVAHLIEARRWNHHLRSTLSLARPLAQELSAEGEALAAEADWEGAYRALATALKLDPRLSWVRRRAEEVRDLKLGITELESPVLEEEEEEEGNPEIEALEAEEIPAPPPMKPRPGAGPGDGLGGPPPIPPGQAPIRRIGPTEKRSEGGPPPR